MDLREEVVVSATSSVELGKSTEKQGASVPDPGSGVLILNADDWGRDRENTDKTLECVLVGAVSSVSAMVFMEDSERAAGIARDRQVDAGLHLNFTAPFSSRGCSDRLRIHQARVCKFLKWNRYAHVVFHPALRNSFEYLVAAQVDEFRHLYGVDPERLDGHHHMHLCANVLLGGLLTPGIQVRRSFFFRPGEKSVLNRFYRKLVDAALARKHRLVDYFFALPPLSPPDRLEKIFALARDFVVEVETHPVHNEEYRFLTGGDIFRIAGDMPISRGFDRARAKACSGNSGSAHTRNLLACSIPYALALGATIYQSLLQVSEYL